MIPMPSEDTSRESTSREGIPKSLIKNLALIEPLLQPDPRDEQAIVELYSSLAKSLSREITSNLIQKADKRVGSTIVSAMKKVLSEYGKIYSKSSFVMTLEMNFRYIAGVVKLRRPDASVPYRIAIGIVPVHFEGVSTERARPINLTLYYLVIPSKMHSALDVIKPYYKRTTLSRGYKIEARLALGDPSGARVGSCRKVTAVIQERTLKYVIPLLIFIIFGRRKSIRILPLRAEPARLGSLCPGNTGEDSP